MYISCIPLHSYADKIEHYVIHVTNDGKHLIDRDTPWGSLPELVEVRRVIILKCIVISAPVHFYGTYIFVIRSRLLQMLTTRHSHHNIMTS